MMGWKASKTMLGISWALGSLYLNEVGHVLKPDVPHVTLVNLGSPQARILSRSIGIYSRECPALQCRPCTKQREWVDNGPYCFHPAHVTFFRWSSSRLLKLLIRHCLLHETRTSRHSREWGIQKSRMDAFRFLVAIWTLSKMEDLMQMCCFSWVRPFIWLAFSNTELCNFLCRSCGWLCNCCSCCEWFCWFCCGCWIGRNA